MRPPLAVTRVVGSFFSSPTDAVFGAPAAFFFSALGAAAVVPVAAVFCAAAGNAAKVVRNAKAPKAEIQAGRLLTPRIDASRRDFLQDDEEPVAMIFGEIVACKSTVHENQCRPAQKPAMTNTAEPANKAARMLLRQSQAIQFTRCQKE